MTQTANKNNTEPLNSIFRPIAEHISKLTGVVLGEKQASQVHSRIAHRMRTLGIPTERQYVEYFLVNKDKESEYLVSLLTTHYTFFFREYAHFEYLIQNLPQLVEQAKKKGRKTLKVWSAASSTGQEAHSIAMLLAYHMPKVDPTMNFEIFGSDVDPQSVATASNGVYRWNELKEAPAMYMASHWARGTGEISEYVKAKSSLKNHLKFEVRNLINLPVNASEKYDVIFCRNVFIYFTKEQIQKVVKNLLTKLEDHGSLITGLSESLADMGLPINHLGKSIYQPQSARGIAGLPTATASAATANVSTLAPKVNEGLIRVLTVDDSASVLAILGKILSKEDGFQIVGKAKNGLEAAEFLKNNTIDVMTLDIHMPQQSGVEYLQASYKKGHPPVIMVSSVRREESDLAIKALNLGAFDYIEKPSLGNLDVIGDEIKAKARFAARYADPKIAITHNIDKEFSKKIYIQDADKKIRNIISSVSDLKKIVHVLKDSASPQPPTVVYVVKPGEILESLKDQIKAQIVNSVEVITDSNVAFKANGVYLANFELFDKIRRDHADKDSVKIVFGSCSEETANGVMRCTRGTLILEDLGGAHENYYERLKRRCDFFVPYTSFSYEAERIFAQNKKIERSAS